MTDELSNSYTQQSLDAYIRDLENQASYEARLADEGFIEMSPNAWAGPVRTLGPDPFEMGWLDFYLIVTTAFGITCGIMLPWWWLVNIYG